MTHVGVEMLGFNFEFLEDVRNALERRGVPATDAYLNPEDAHRLLEENCPDLIDLRTDSLGVIAEMVIHRDENVPRGDFIVVSTDHPARGVAVGRVVERLSVARELSYRDPAKDSWEFSQVETAADYAEHLKRAAAGWTR